MDLDKYMPDDHKQPSGDETENWKIAKLENWIKTAETQAADEVCARKYP